MLLSITPQERHLPPNASTQTWGNPPNTTQWVSGAKVRTLVSTTKLHSKGKKNPAAGEDLGKLLFSPSLPSHNPTLRCKPTKITSGVSKIKCKSPECLQNAQSSLQSAVARRQKTLKPTVTGLSSCRCRQRNP